jgi:hypothetical protein
VAKDPGQNHTVPSTQQPAPKAGTQTVNAIAAAVDQANQASQSFLGARSEPVKPAGGDNFIKADSMEPKVVSWNSRSSDAFGAERVGNPDVSIDAKNASQQDAPAETETAAEGEATETAEVATETETAAETETKAADAKPEDKVEAKTEAKADEKKTDETEKKDETVKPKIPKPNGAATRRDAMRALKLEGDLRAEQAERQRLATQLTEQQTKLKTAPLDEKLGMLGLTIEEIREYAITGALPEPKPPQAEKPAEEAKPHPLEEKVTRMEQQLHASQQRETIALAMADIGAMEVPLVKGTAGAMQAVINEAATYYNQTGGKIDGNEVPFRDYIQSFALHKEAELKEAAPRVRDELAARVAQIDRLLGRAPAAGDTKTETATTAAKPTNGGPRAPIGKKLAARSTTNDDDKYSMDPLQRDLEIKRELGWG